MTFWHIEQRDAREPLDCWRNIKLLLTDTPGPGATEDQIILKALNNWKDHMHPDGLMVVHSHIARIDMTGIQWRDHNTYAQVGLDKWIEQLTEPGEIVADPFCGSSVCGLYALRLGRSFIGTDIGRAQIETSYVTLTEGRSDEESRWTDEGPQAA